jgi:4-hydroxybenzoate polyprenyltransferase
MRLPDQYLQVFSSLAAGVYLSDRSLWIFLWTLSLTSFSITAAMLNELTDRNDSDKYSWNHKVHVGDENFSMPIVWTLFLLFALLGLWLSYLSGLFGWGIVFFVLGLLYSIEPIRLKKWPIVDVLCLVAVWWGIPFLAPVSLFTEWEPSFLLFLLSFGFLSWSTFLPYVLADFEADKKAKFLSTHVIMGVSGSLLFGLILTILGIISYVISGIYMTQMWTAVEMFFAIYAVYKYVLWIKMKKQSDQISSFRDYVRFLKPLSRLLVPYMLLFYIF